MKTHIQRNLVVYIEGQLDSWCVVIPSRVCLRLENLWISFMNLLSSVVRKPLEGSTVHVTSGSTVEWPDGTFLTWLYHLPSSPVYQNDLAGLGQFLNFFPLTQEVMFSTLYEMPALL